MDKHSSLFQKFVAVIRFITLVPWFSHCEVKRETDIETMMKRKRIRGTDKQRFFEKRQRNRKTSSKEGNTSTDKGKQNKQTDKEAVQ